MLKYLKWIISGEFLFALFLLAGYFKGAFNTRFLDITILLLVVTLLIAAKNVKGKKMIIAKYHIFPIVAFLFLGIGALISLSYTPSNIYAWDKFIRFIVITTWCFCGGFFLFKNSDSIKKFFAGLISVALVMAVTSILGDDSAYKGFSAALGSNYMSLARGTAMALLILIIYFVFSKAKMYKRNLALLLACFLLIPLLQSGGRLPVLILITILISLPMYAIKYHYKSIIISKRVIPLLGLFFLLVISSIFFISKGYGDTLIYRMEVMVFETGGGNSISGRSERFSTAWDMSKDSYFIGKGIGSFPIYHSGMDVEDYPHNIYLEYLSELGILPTTFFVCIIALAFYNGIVLYRRKRGSFNPSQIAVITIALFWLINSIGSSSINGDKLFYAFLSVMIVSPYLEKNSGA